MSRPLSDPLNDRKREATENLWGKLGKLVALKGLCRIDNVALVLKSLETPDLNDRKW